jgi:hypothetical protein
VRRDERREDHETYSREKCQRGASDCVHPGIIRPLMGALDRRQTVH